MNSPFTHAQKRHRKIKLFLWGSYGVGKTSIALQFPKPVLIDLEIRPNIRVNRLEFHPSVQFRAKTATPGQDRC